MSGGTKRNADKVNVIGVVMIGICAAVLVYVSIVGLQAFYANDSSDVQTMADYGGQDKTAKDLRAEQIGHITQAKSNGKSGTYTVDIKVGMQKVLEAAKADPTTTVPAIGPSVTPTIDSVFGRPKALGTGTGSATPAAPTEPAPGMDGSAAGSGAGSAAATTPTGTAPGQPNTSAPGAPPAGAGSGSGAGSNAR